MSNHRLFHSRIYVGLFLVALATLMFEILLTRIFSVTMWYHFAFMAISIAMFGMTVGALIVYLCPHYFSRNRAEYLLCLYAMLFAVSIVLSFLTQLAIPFIEPTLENLSVSIVYALLLKYLVLSVPFVFSGICVCLALTAFVDRVSKLYAADLAGAAIGCVALIYCLNATDGPTTVIAVAFLASLGAPFFVGWGGNRTLRFFSALCSVALATFTVGHALLLWNGSPILRILWVKGAIEKPALYEKWNSYSRIRITGDPKEPMPPFGWGLSKTYPADKKFLQLAMHIDSVAATALTKFDNNPAELDFLKYDVTNAAHWLRKKADVLVVGVGGGRDILSALVFDQNSVVGVELNHDIIKSVNGDFGDFTGHLDRHPKVTFVNDEARSYIARQKDTFDIIQISLIDTWAATAAGAYVLSENVLYTIEAWKVFLKRLKPGGLLTVSRWYDDKYTHGETYRLASLATTALKEYGINQPQLCQAMVRCDKIGTILVSNKPFSQADLEAIDDLARRMDFEIIYAPDHKNNPTFDKITSGIGLAKFVKDFPVNISAPRDDSPFFFHVLRLSDLFKKSIWKSGIDGWFNVKAVLLLGILTIVVFMLTVMFIIVPLILKGNIGRRVDTVPFVFYFAGIGLGFMFIEISQLQSLIIFLGHPTYSLSVVLFSLLLSTGIGSYLTERVQLNGPLPWEVVVRLTFLIVILTVFGIVRRYIMIEISASVTPMRILVAVLMLSPLGLFMGMAFPLGMKMAQRNAGHMTPWLWGVNGATSVLASVLAIAVSLFFSISAAFWAGVACYVLSIGALIASRSPALQEGELHQ